MRASLLSTAVDKGTPRARKGNIMNHNPPVRPVLDRDRFVVTLDDGETIALVPGVQAPGRRFHNVDLAMIKLAGANLDGCIFDDCDLSFVDFAHASLEGAQFNGCFLNHTIFIGANLRGAEFLLDVVARGLRLEQADLTGAFFAGVDRCEIHGSIATGANLFGAVFQDLFLNTCDFDGANAGNTRWIKVAYDDVRLRNGDLAFAEFHRCRFDEVVLTNTVMVGTTFNDCATAYMALDLTGADLGGATFDHCHFGAEGPCDPVVAIGTDFRNTKFIRSQFFQADFTRARFDGSVLMNTGFNETTQTGTNWTDTKAVDTRLRHCVFDDATLAGAVFRGCALHGAVFNQEGKTVAQFDECDFAPPVTGTDETLNN